MTKARKIKKNEFMSFGMAQDIYINCGPTHERYEEAVAFFSKPGMEKAKEAHDKLVRWNKNK